MTQKVLFFIFPVLLVLLPVIIHNRYSPFMAKTWLRIIAVPSAKKVPANILFVLLSFFSLSQTSLATLTFLPFAETSDSKEIVSLRLMFQISTIISSTNSMYNLAYYELFQT